jgi:Putative prokaryotic signal transducing protein
MMYCPKCGAEYRDGFTLCSDCDEALMNEPPAAPAATPNFSHLEEILSTIDSGQIALVKSILEAERIHYVAQGEHSHFLQSPIPVRFLVAQEDIARARELLDFLL